MSEVEQQLAKEYSFRASQRMLEVSRKPPADVFAAGESFALREVLELIEAERNDTGYELANEHVKTKIEAMLDNHEPFQPGDV